MLEHIKSALGNITDMSLKNTILVAPCLEQQTLYRKIKLTDAIWADLQISTANKAEGAKEESICYDGTAAADMGGKVAFCADFHRLAIILSRQRNGLLLIVDFNSAIQTRKKKGPPPRPE